MRLIGPGMLDGNAAQPFDAFAHAQTPDLCLPAWFVFGFSSEGMPTLSCEDTVLVMIVPMLQPPR